MPWLPDLRTPEKDRVFFADVVLARHRVWVAERNGATVGIKPGA